MDGPTSDENSDIAPDDAFSMICGDLGLGENSRSSASLRYELEILSDSEFLLKSETSKHRSLATIGKGYPEDLARFDRKSRSSSFEERSTPSKTLDKKKSGSNGNVSKAKRRPHLKTLF